LNPKFQKVISGLTACSRPGFEETVCTECPYYENYFADRVDEDTFVANFTEDSCSYRLTKDALNLLKEYDSALRGMVYQYCTAQKQFLKGKDCDMPNQEVFFHSFMSAGEEAFRVLGIENSEEVTDEFIWS